jgi:hypothetical protein
MTRPALLSLALLVSSVGVAPAADLIEPWDPGLSNLELYLLQSGPEGETAVAGLLGGGVGKGVSLGVALQRATGQRSRAVLLGYLTRPLGKNAEVDLFGELGGQEVAGPEGEIRRADWMLGSEWSLPVGRTVPYTRWSLVHQGARFVYGLVGVMLPIGEALELHLELDGVVSGGSRGPERIAVGPNLILSPTVELLPEISVLRDRESGEEGWAVTLGLVVDPRGRRSREGEREAGP